jgi:hypothetical protein
MKNLVLTLITLVGMSAQASLCENVDGEKLTNTYGLNKLTKSGVIVKLQTVNPAVQTPAVYELGMIQAVVSEVNPETPMTPAQALDVFTDAEHGGILGGNVTYFAIPGGTDLLALVTYFPGENEYGDIFKLSHVRGQWFVTKIAVVDDSEIFDCHF